MRRFNSCDYELRYVIFIALQALYFRVLSLTVNCFALLPCVDQMTESARLLLILILNLQNLLVQHISYLMLGHREIYGPRSLQSVD